MTIEQLQIIIASYFRYYGVDVAEMLTMYSESDQHRITQMFTNIVEGDLYTKNEDIEDTKITIAVAKDILKPVRMFLELFLLDKMAEETMVKAREYLAHGGELCSQNLKH